MTPDEIQLKLLDIIKSLLQVNSNYVRIITEFRNHTNAAVVLSATEILKEQIHLCISLHFNPLKSRDIKRILGQPASPKGLAVQLDVAHALGILDDATYEITIKVLALRNIFGHDKNQISLHQEPALSAFRELHTNPKFVGSYASVFLQYVGVVQSHIEGYLASYQPVDT